MVQKLKQIGIIALCVIGFIGIIGLIILTVGKNQKIRKLVSALSDTWKKNVAVKEAENAVLDDAYERLTEQERAIIETIKNEPTLHLPEHIDRTDYKAMLKWFRALENNYT